MKHLTTFIIVLSTIQLFAQDEYPRVEKIVVTDKLFQGQIDKYPITMYLKFEQYSNYHAGVYSVKGWYYYDKVKTKIPVTGLYDYPELFIYQFNDTNKSNELLHFLEMKENHWEDMKYYKNLIGYKEKFVLSDSGNFWTDGSKTLNVSLTNDDLEIQTVSEFLLLDSNSAFNLHNFGAWTWNFQIVAHKSRKFILNYEHGSRLYVMGQCGAGIERGYFIIEFDEDYNLTEYDEFIYESCNGSISTEEQEKKSEYITTYQCYDYMNENEFYLTVDLNQLKIEKKEKN